MLILGSVASGRFAAWRVTRHLHAARYWQGRYDVRLALHHARISHRALATVVQASRILQAEVLLTLAETERNAGDPAAHEHFLAGHAAASAVPDVPATPGRTRLLARATAGQGDSYRRTGYPQQALDILHRAVTLIDALDPPVPQLHAAARTALAITAKECGDFETAARMYLTLRRPWSRRRGDDMRRPALPAVSAPVLHMRIQPPLPLGSLDRSHMEPRRSIRLGTLAAGVAGLLVAAGLNSPNALADQTDSYLVSSTINNSDPFSMTCFDAATGFSGTCLYTSSDVGSGSSADHPYPMNVTRLFTLSDGLDPSVQSNWVSRGTVFSESQITTNVSGGFVPSGANHLWAPAVAIGGDGNYYLYVPDVSDNSTTGVHLTSHMAVAKSSSPFGPFTYLKQMTIPGYASDPEVMQTMEPARYMVFANGDTTHCTDTVSCGGTGPGGAHYSGTGTGCGGLSIGTLPATGTEEAIMTNVNNPQPITINGLSGLGNCGGTLRPYLEGPSLYFTTPWGSGVPGPYLLVFAAKPDHTPAECVNYTEPNTPNEVIAYAVSDSPTGTYQYQGILMCGSKTEWTNQASIIPMHTVDGSGTRLVMVYHDGPGAPPRRKTHAVCLYYGAGRFAQATRNFSVGSTLGDCMSGSSVAQSRVVLRAENTGLLVTAENAGNSSLRATRYAAGAWEKFYIRDEGNGKIAILADINTKWVGVSIGTSAAYLIPNGAGSSDPSLSVSESYWPTWTNGGQTVGLTSAWLGTPIVQFGAVPGELRADAPSNFPMTMFDVLHI